MSCVARLFLLLALCCYLSKPTISAQNKFSTCQNSPFCGRYFGYTQYLERSDQSHRVEFYSISNGSCHLSDSKTKLLCKLQRRGDSSSLQLKLEQHTSGVLRIRINESIIDKRRYETGRNRVIQDDVLDAQRCTITIQPLKELLIGRASCTPYQQHIISGRGLGLSNSSIPSNKHYGFRIYYKPFVIESVVDDVVMHRVNSRNGLNWEFINISNRIVTEMEQTCIYCGALTQSSGGIVGTEFNEMIETTLVDEGVPCWLLEIRCAMYNEFTCHTNSTHSKEMHKMNIQKAAQSCKSRFDTTCFLTENWEATILGQDDRNKYGPQAVAIDVEALNATNFYGLFEHTTNLMLPYLDEPYRFYNVDNNNYKMDQPTAMYSSIPLLNALQKIGNTTTASSMLWNNPADTWVKLKNTNYSASAWWVSETGVIDLFLSMGPSPAAVLEQYHIISGFPAFHPMFSLGKHQSRFSYETQEDLLTVDYLMDAYNLPYDTIWLDIDYAIDRQYFRWNLNTFPDPQRLAKYFADKSRYLVLIVDPHVHAHPSYDLYNELALNNYGVKLDTGRQLFGECWPPGKSVYPDFMNPVVEEWFSEAYLKNNVFKNNSNVFIWNDMNEPADFQFAELTLPKSSLMHEGYEMRAVHNEYGLRVISATVKAMAKRNATQRPFILSRAGYIGVHQHAFMWTGDNKSTWQHYMRSVAMMLSASMCGISAIGADVGGFSGNPQPELLAAWHELGAWYPFYREHSIKESNRRDPWLWSDNVLERVKDAATVRYRLLQHWYTLLAEYAFGGSPIIRPLWWMDVNDETLHSNDNSYLLGNEFVVQPLDLSQHGWNNVVQLPNVHAGWFDYWSKEWYVKKTLNIQMSARSVAVFVAPGSIILEKRTSRASSTLQMSDSLTITMYLDATSTNPSAEGKVFIDDGQTYSYKRGEFVYGKFVFKDSTLQYTNLPIYMEDAKIVMKNTPKTNVLLMSRTLKKLLVYGLKRKPSHIHLISDEHSEDISVAAIKANDHWKLSAKLPKFNFDSMKWSIEIIYT